MNAEHSPNVNWSPSEETILLLARELEWAEAYAADHPRCRMGRLYLEFVRRELVAAQSEL